MASRNVSSPVPSRSSASRDSGSSAANIGASVIHLEPKRDRMQVRFRIDGTMVEQPQIPLEVAGQVVSRIKVLARMDISERRIPQDGQFTLEAGLGYLINVGRGQYDTALVFVAILSLMVMALSLYGIVLLVEKRTLKWHNRQLAEKL